MSHVFLTRSTSGSIPPLAELFFSLPFQISNRIVKAFIFNKNEGNNQKVENKVTGQKVEKKKTWLVIYHLHHWSWWYNRLCCASSGSSCTLIDRCLVQSAVSNLFPNQWRCLKLYLPLPVCLICRCVFWLVVLFLDLPLCFLTCYFVFEFFIVFSDLL